MTVERARQRAVSKPWGSIDLRPWSTLGDGVARTGEIWFERGSAAAPAPVLLIKLLFTTAALSIQVHPDDQFAQSMGLPNGKSEAWYVLSAAEGAKVAVGLRQPLDADQLRSAISDGSIESIVDWRTVRAGEFLTVPAGTIHAIGADLVIAEIQQRSDITFRLFDYGRDRVLHIDQGVAASHPTPSEPQTTASPSCASRSVLTSNPHFIVEKIDVLPRSAWRLQALRETWLLAIGGGAQLGEIAVAPGEAVFLNEETVVVQAGIEGFQALVAYPGPGVACRLLEEVRASIPDAGPVELLEANL